MNYLSLLLFLIETSLQSMLSGVALLRTRNHSRFVRESWGAAIRQFSAILLVRGGRKHRARYPQTVSIRS